MVQGFLITGLFLAAIGRGSDGDPMDPANNEDPGSLPVGTFRAQIDGEQWSANGPLSIVNTGGVFAVSGSNAELTTLAFAVIVDDPVPGTYQIGPTLPTNGVLTIGSADATWVADSQGGSGSVTITSFSSTGAAGTFQFTMVPNGTSGSTGVQLEHESSLSFAFAIISSIEPLSGIKALLPLPDTIDRRHPPLRHNHTRKWKMKA